jgi:hypothetical protein
MRNSNARALSLARWQYDLLMAWAGAVTRPEGPSTLSLVLNGGLSPKVAERRRRVLAALDAGEAVTSAGENPE